MPMRCVLCLLLKSIAQKVCTSVTAAMHPPAHTATLPAVINACRQHAKALACLLA